MVLLLVISVIGLVVVFLAWCLGRAAATREVAADREGVVFHLPTDVNQQRYTEEGKL
jgi:hypothetical protein